MWFARLYDGETADAQSATVSVAADRLRIDEPGRELPLRDLDIGEWFQGAPRCIGLPDGARLHVQDEDGSFDRALRCAGYRTGLAGRLFGNWRSAMACIAALVLLLVWIDRQGAGLLAQAALPLVPRAIDERLGQTTLQALDLRWLGPTKLSAERQAALTPRLVKLFEHHPEARWWLVYRSARDNAVNAFAVPGGGIVLLDALVEKLTDDEVLAVVAHEVGHVTRRHVMHGLVRQAGLYQVASVVVGDYSSALSITLAGLQGLRFTRDFEREADALALKILREEGVSPQAMADALRVLQRESERKGALVPEFLSTHPATADRIRVAEQAAAQK